MHHRTLERLGTKALAAFGNEHNFVWKRKDGLFYHGKGATPAWNDETGRPLIGVIPLNMASPILLTLGGGNETYLSFSPHGAGRNMSRTALLKKVRLHGLAAATFLAQARTLLAEQTEGLDIRFFYDRPDISETPIAYKSANQVRAQIDHFALANVIGLIEPRGCIMAGDCDKPWLKPR